MADDTRDKMIIGAYIEARSCERLALNHSIRTPARATTPRH